MRASVLMLALALPGCARDPAPIEQAPPTPAPAPATAPACSPSAFEHAPPPTRIDGLPAAPIDMLALAGQLEFDAATRQAHARATLRFQLGAAGMPIFDLRQTPRSATLDGEPIELGKLARHDFGMGEPAGMRVLEVELAACSIHELALEYPLAAPDAAQSKGPQWQQRPPGLRFDIWMSDLHPGRYLESWLPATLPYDQFALTIEIDLLGAELDHALITNAEVEQLGEHAWLLEFPPTSRVNSPLIAIAPREDLLIESGVFPSAKGQDIAWTLVVESSLATPIDAYAEPLLGWLDDFERSTGEYVHPALIAYLGPANRSMEYDGALTAEPKALEHELFHSWWGRGRWPLRHADGWIDEAWNVYSTGPGAFASEPFDWKRAPVVLAHAHPFTRATPNAAYMAGRRLFAGLADLLGVATLQAAMAEYYVRQPNSGMSTEGLERFLICEFDHPEDIHRGFDRFVRGLEGEVEPRPNWCSTSAAPMQQLRLLDP